MHTTSTSRYTKGVRIRMKITSGTLLILNPAWTMIRQAVLARPSLEVYGMGHCVIDEDGIAVMDDIYIPPQDVMAGKFEVSGDELVKAFDSLIREYGEKWIEWCVMWHSHCTMNSVEPSTTDVVNLAQIVRNNMDYAIGLIVNVSGDAFAWAEMTKPWETQAELDVIIGDAHYPKLAKKVDAWMEHVVEKKVAVVQHGALRRVPPWWQKEEEEALAAEAMKKNGGHASDDGPEWSAADDLMQLGLTFADGGLDKYSKKSIDRLARAVVEGSVGDGCDAQHAEVSCILVKDHKQKVHVGIIDGMPAYFQNGGKSPSVDHIKSVGFPI